MPEFEALYSRLTTRLGYLQTLTRQNEFAPHDVL
jgi:hypothetical protein